MTVDRRLAATSRPTSAPAGNLTFNVTNSGSKVTEFYLYSADGKRIVGEVENIGPGLQGKLIVTAERGQLPDRRAGPACPARASAPDFTVTEPADGLAGAVARTGADQQGAERVPRLGAAAGRPAGRPDRSASWRRTSRGTTTSRAGSTRRRAFHWEAIETVAESFGDLDPKTDAREADLTPGPEVDRLAPDREGPLAAAGEGLHAADA